MFAQIQRPTPGLQADMSGNTGGDFRVKTEGHRNGSFSERDLGLFTFQLTPLRGDTIVLYHDGEFKKLRVVGLEHHPLENPVAYPENENWRKTFRTTIRTEETEY
ncbi:hypothetical protein [Erythrobacter litoralis]|uniref:hypothetical protein n=1 Tax=Erythrobacter litoralis TaxID=39960 RepID=UPI00243574D7|nr:hypothetical protein [Erythrobacter litoralis]